MFAIALVPSIVSKDKPAMATSLMVALVLIGFTVTYASLGLWFTTIVTVVTVVLWLTLFVQKLLAKRRSA